MPPLMEIYIATGGLGFVYIMATALMGMVDSGDAGGDAGDGDGGDLGSADDGGGDLGGADDGGDLSSLEVKAVNSFKAGLAIRKKERTMGPVLRILKWISPSTVSTFMLFFGMCGYLLLHYVAFLGILTMPLAIAGGIVGQSTCSSLIGKMLKKMHKSTSYHHDQVLGTIAEVTVSISPGKLGEVTYLAHGVRDTAPARGHDAKATYKSGTSVVLVDLEEGIFEVDTFEQHGDGALIRDPQQIVKEQ